MSITTPLVQIGLQPARRQRSAVPAALERLSHGSLVDKFFLVGMVAAILGTLWLGVHLWLGLNGQISLPSDYARLRTVHSITQLYLFVGSFIFGFLAQASGRILGVNSRGGLWAWGLIALLCLAVYLLFYGYPLGAVRAILSVICFGALGLFWRSARLATPENRYRLAAPVSCALCTMSFGVWLDLSSGPQALCVTWAGIIGIILAISQQFFFGVLKGRKLAPSRARLVFGLYLAASAAIALFSYDAIAFRSCYRGFGVLSFLTIAFYCAETHALRAAWAERCAALGFAYLSGLLWAFAGSLIVFSFQGASDAALHVWTLGLITPLIMAVSARIIGFLSNAPALPEGLLLSLLAFWQVVPLTRGLGYLLGIPPIASWVTAVVSGGVMTTWLVAITLGIARMLKSQLCTPRADSLPTC